MTKAADNEAFVRAFQSAHGLKEDGWAGKYTFAALGVVPEVPSAGSVDPQLILDLKRDEGLRLTAYPDPLSGGEPFTVGYGATGKGLQKGTVWTQEQAERRLVEMALDHGQRLEQKLPWVAQLDPVRRRVLHNMAYNLGVDGLLEFKNTLEAVRTGRYLQASSGMLNSLWAKQVGQRAVRLALQMQTGS